jgi:hypothetical protein
MGHSQRYHAGEAQHFANRQGNRPTKVAAARKPMLLDGLTVRRLQAIVPPPAFALKKSLQK